MKHFIPIMILLVMLASCSATKQATLKKSEEVKESLAVGLIGRERTIREAAKQVLDTQNMEVVIEEFDMLNNDSVATEKPILRKRTTAKIKAVRSEQSKDSISIDRDIGMTAKKQLNADVKIENEIKKSQPISLKVFILLVVVVTVLIILSK